MVAVVTVRFRLPITRAGNVEGMSEQITRDELRSAIAGGTVTVVDALPPAPYGKRHLPSAVNLTKEDPDQRVTEVLPDPAATVVVYSTDADCDRGPGMAGRLRALGYSDVRLYRDGIDDWVDAGLPVHAGT